MKGVLWGLVLFIIQKSSSFGNSKIVLDERFEGFWKA